ncbi:MAG: leucine-rich repeat domain-containing protein [Acutalibacteraceae bacterium]
MRFFSFSRPPKSSPGDVTPTAPSGEAGGTRSPKAEWRLDEEGCLWIRGGAVPGRADPLDAAGRPSGPFVGLPVRQIKVMEGVPEIGAFAFFGCRELTAIHLPASLTALSWTALQGCPSLTAITVDPANPRFSAADGVLFDKTGQTLIACPVGRRGKYRVPAPVRRIADHAFHRCVGLTGVTLPAGLQTVGAFAFAECAALTRLDFAAPPLTVGAYAFWHCPPSAQASLSSDGDKNSAATAR